MTPIPTPEDVAAVAAMPNLAARNREVTRGYYLFSERLRASLGQEATWPTFAGWASAQAGRTIRKEDLLRVLERRLGDSEAVRRIVHGPLRLAARYVLDAVLDLNPFERSSQAVAQGNIKVYAEIGSEFARFLAILQSGAAPEDLAAFIDSLSPGPPPEGQDYLKRAFPALWRAIREPAGDARSELILLANLCIGFHEQTRLQPEIEASVDGSAWDGLELKNRLFDRLLPHLGPVRGVLARAALRASLEPALTPLVNEVRRLVREIVTETMMVLELPGETLRLSRDLTGGFSEALRSIHDTEARQILTEIDTTPDSLVDSSACDWTAFPDRMHFIADLFRSRQADLRLFERAPE